MKNNNGGFFSQGGKCLIAYLVIDYIIPLFLNLIIDTNPLFKLPIEDEDVLFSFIFLSVIFFLAVICACNTPIIVPRNRVPIRPLTRTFLIFFSLLAIVVGLYLLSQNNVQWRYGKEGLMLAGRYMIVVSLVQSLVPVIVFWVLISDHNLIMGRGRDSFITKFLLLAALTLSVNGLGSALFAAFIALVFLKPAILLSIMFLNTGRSGFLRKGLNVLSILLPAMVFCSLFFLVGHFAKQSTFKGDNIASAYTGVDYLINRHSVHLSVATASIKDGGDFDRIMIPVNTFSYRMTLLTGIGSDRVRPVINSFSRLALIQFANFEKINPRGGASPGLIGTLTMLFPVVIASTFLFLVVFILVKMIDYILVFQPKLSWVGACVFAYFPLRYLVDSPFDAILPGPTLIVLMFVFYMGARRSKRATIFAKACFGHPSPSKRQKSRGS